MYRALRRFPLPGVWTVGKYAPLRVPGAVVRQCDAEGYTGNLRTGRKGDASGMGEWEKSYSITIGE